MDETILKASRILMLDDNVANTCLVTNVLHRLGYTTVESVNDPRLIFAAIESFAPDLLLLDLSMPEVNGFDVLQFVRKSTDAAARLPVIVITGDATAANKRRALASGATDLLAKPFDPSEAKHAHPERAGAPAPPAAESRSKIASSNASSASGPSSWNMR
jgi:putative two-component system response regulator